MHDDRQFACHGHSSSFALVVTAHRLGTVVQAGHIVVVEHGRVVAQGRHDALLAGAGLYARMWDVHRRGREMGLRREAEGAVS